MVSWWFQSLSSGFIGHMFWRILENAFMLSVFFIKKVTYFLSKLLKRNHDSFNSLSFEYADCKYAVFLDEGFATTCTNCIVLTFAQACRL